MSDTIHLSVESGPINKLLPAICLLLALIPFQGYFNFYKNLSISAAQLLAVLLFICSIPRAIKKIDYFEYAFPLTVLIFWIIMFMGIYVSNNRVNSIKYFMKWSCFLSLYFIIIVNIDTKRELRAILKILVIGVSAISVIGLFEYLAGPEAILRWFSVNPLAGFIMEPESLKHKLSTGEFNWLIWTGTRCGLRVFGTFECVIVFSAYLGLSIPFFPWIKSYWFAGKYGLAKTVAMFFTIFLTLILTFSRSGYLSFIVMGIVFGVLLIKKIRFGKVAVVVALTTALVGGVIYMRGSVRDTLNTRFNKPVEEQFDRKPLWRNGIRIFLAKPLFGVGLANYDEGLAKYAGKEALILPAHNNYIQVAAEMGLTGVLAYLSVLLAGIWYSFKIFVHASDNEIKYLALGFVGMWSWYCTQSMFNTYLFADKFSMMFWLMAGLNAVLYRIFRNETIGNPGNLTL